MRTHSQVGIRPEVAHLADLEGFDALAELALDLRWLWHHANDEVWR